MELREVTVAEADDGTRLDRFIRRRYDGINQGRIEKLLRSGSIRVDGGRAKSNTRLAAGQIVSMPGEVAVESSRAKPSPATGAPDAATIATLRHAKIAQGDGWLAINKPSGLASQGGKGVSNHVAGAIAAAFPDAPEPPRLVHRLDRDTSGIMVVATTLARTHELARGFRDGAHRKTYLAFALGVPRSQAGLIDAPLAKSGPRGQEKMAVDTESGMAARTQYKVLEAFGKAASLVALRPLTGRTHQLRAHMAAMGCPLLGDGKYGGRAAFPNDSVTRLCLHAAHLVLASGEEISAPVPADLDGVMDFFGVDKMEVLARAAHDFSTIEV